MDMITVTAKTVDEAVTKALIELETTSDKLEYEVVEKGSAVRAPMQAVRLLNFEALLNQCF